MEYMIAQPISMPSYMDIPRRLITKFIDRIDRKTLQGFGSLECVLH